VETVFYVSIFSTGSTVILNRLSHLNKCIDSEPGVISEGGVIRRDCLEGVECEVQPSNTYSMMENKDRIWRGLCEDISQLKEHGLNNSWWHMESGDKRKMSALNQSIFRTLVKNNVRWIEWRLFIEKQSQSLFNRQ
jgi:hypothetical protein